MSSGGARPRVVYWNHIPTPYTVARFNHIASRANLDFEAWFNAATEAGRSWLVDTRQWNFNYRFVPVLRLPGRSLAVAPPLIDRRPPDLIISLYARPVFLLGFLAARHRGARTALWVEITFDEWVKRSWWKEKAKRFLFPRADGILTFGDQGRAYVASYGVSTDRMHHIIQGIDVAYYRDRTAAYPQGGDARIALRRQLGLKGTVFLYAGRIVPEKGLDILIEAFVKAQAQMETDVSLLIVGEGAYATHCERKLDELGGKNLVMAGFVPDDDVPTYYAISDVFVFPTLGDPYGLVINEALASGLPVISTTTAGEVGDRVVDGTNGYLVPPRDARILADRMVQLGEDSQRRLHMAAAARESGNVMTLDAYSSSMERAVEEILASPPVGRSDT